MASKRLSSCMHLINTCGSGCPKYVLHDIYYLSGYILEGFVVYCIYKIYGWDECTPIDDWKGMDSKALNNFFASTHLCFHRQEQKTQKYSIEGHRFQEYVHILHRRPEFSSLSFFSSRELNSNIKNLVDNWEPEIRYSYKSVSLSVENLKSLLTFCSRAQGVIINEIGYEELD